MSLKNEETRFAAISLRSLGHTYTEISNTLGIPQTTINDFLSKRTFSKWWSSFEAGELDYTPSKGPRIGTIDIETSPIQAYSWGIWNVNIAPNQIIKDWEILCYSLKILGEENIQTFSCAEDYCSAKKYKGQDKEFLLDSLWNTLDTCDILIAHNGNRFDNKKIRTKLKQNGYPPPSSYKVIDTLKIAKSQFSFTSNRLDFLSKALGSEGKMVNSGMPLWIGCLNGDVDSWDFMLKYCDKDIIELEKVYLEIRGWDSYHPNLAVYYDDDIMRCNNCQGTKFAPIEHKKGTTNLSKFKLVRCLNSSCGATLRTRNNVRSKKAMQNTLMQVR